MKLDHQKTGYQGGLWLAPYRMTSIESILMLFSYQKPMKSINCVFFRAVAEKFFHITQFSVYQLMKMNIFFILFWNHFAFPEKVISFLFL